MSGQACVPYPKACLIACWPPLLCLITVAVHKLRQAASALAVVHSLHTVHRLMGPAEPAAPPSLSQQLAQLPVAWHATPRVLSCTPVSNLLQLVTASHQMASGCQPLRLCCCMTSTNQVAARCAQQHNTCPLCLLRTPHQTSTPLLLSLQLSVTMYRHPCTRYASRPPSFAPAPCTPQLHLLLCVQQLSVS